MNRLSIKVTSNAKTPSSISGLHIFADLFQKFEIQSLIQSCLLKKKRNSGWKSSEKFACGVLGFISGVQCLDDFDWLEPKMHKIVFRINATTHEQFGEKMEGVEW